jgi:putative transposase
VYFLFGIRPSFDETYSKGGSILWWQVNELLNVEIFYSLAEARIMIEQWRRHYNAVRPHSALGYRPPAPSVVQWPAAPDSSTVARPATAPLAPSASLN